MLVFGDYYGFDGNGLRTVFSTCRAGKFLHIVVTKIKLHIFDMGKFSIPKRNCIWAKSGEQVLMKLNSILQEKINSDTVQKPVVWWFFFLMCTFFFYSFFFKTQKESRGHAHKRKIMR